MMKILLLLMAFLGLVGSASAKACPVGDDIIPFCPKDKFAEDLEDCVPDKMAEKLANVPDCQLLYTPCRCGSGLKCTAKPIRQQQVGAPLFRCVYNENALNQDRGEGSQNLLQSY